MGNVHIGRYYIIFDEERQEVIKNGFFSLSAKRIQINLYRQNIPLEIWTVRYLGSLPGYSRLTPQTSDFKG
jgi:hypothetical protein